jgi:hypothetical protein
VLAHEDETPVSAGAYAAKRATGEAPRQTRSRQ